MTTQGLYFLSYSRADETLALRFADDLRAQGVNIWVDQYEIRPSQHWDRAIERAVQACQGLVVMLSPRSVASENVADEISFAIDSGKKVIPVLIEKCTVPLRVTRMHMLDATRNYGEALRQCLAEMERGGDVETPVAPRPPPAPRVDADHVADAERTLTPFLGPMAGRMVKQAATVATSLDDFHQLLTDRLPQGRQRQEVLDALACRPTPPKRTATVAASAGGTDPGAGITSTRTDELARLLTRFLGPIAPMVVKRESRACTSQADLLARLGQAIPAPKDRAEFLRQAEAAGA